MKATRMFEQAVYGAAYGQGILCADDNTDGDESVDEGGRFNPRQMEVPTAFLDAMEGAIREKSFGRLEEAVDRWGKWKPSLICRGRKARYLLPPRGPARCAWSSSLDDPKQGAQMTSWWSTEQPGLGVLWFPSWAGSRADKGCSTRTKSLKVKIVRNRVLVASNEHVNVKLGGFWHHLTCCDVSRPTVPPSVSKLPKSSFLLLQPKDMRTASKVVWLAPFVWQSWLSIPWRVAAWGNWRFSLGCTCCVVCAWRKNRPEGDFGRSGRVLTHRSSPYRGLRCTAPAVVRLCSSKGRVRGARPNAATHKTTPTGVRRFFFMTAKVDFLRARSGVPQWPTTQIALYTSWNEASLETA